MIKIFSNKPAKIVIIAVLVAFVVFAMAIPFVNSMIKSANDEIDDAVYALCEYPDIDKRKVKRFVDKMENVLSADWKKEKFETKVVNEIAKMNAGLDATEFERTVYDITAQQILLEAAGYKSEAINNAYDKKISEILQQQSQRLEFDDFLKALIEEPFPTMNEEEKVLDVTLSYYTSPRTELLSGFLTQYIDEITNDAVASKNTNDIMSLCKKLSILAEYPEIDDGQRADMSEIIKILTTDAEKIIIKAGEGGYYEGNENTTSSDNESDELFNYVASEITGTDVDSNSYKVKDMKYYGDLSSYFFESGFAYSYEDEDEKKQSNSKKNHTTRLVFLKGEIIHEGDTVDEKYIKYAYEDGMANYHKDGNCFAIGESSLVCYVGNETFNLYFEKK